MLQSILRRVLSLALLLPLAVACDEDEGTLLDVTPAPLIRVQDAQLVDVTADVDPIGTCDGCSRFVSVTRVPRGSGVVRLTFVLDRPSATDVTFTLTPLTPTTAARQDFLDATYNLATPGDDFTYASPTGIPVTIPAGQTSATVEVGTVLTGTPSTVEGIAIANEVFGFTIARASQVGAVTGGYPTIFEWLVEIV